LIFITAKFRVRPEHADDWPEIVRWFTDATRAEPGCLWFDWSRSIHDPHEYVLIEAFADDDSAGAHVTSEHFSKAKDELPGYLAETPQIINVTLPGTEWSELGELRVE
jgi:quinol monooxygenase YgiN